MKNWRYREAFGISRPPQQSGDRRVFLPVRKEVEVQDGSGRKVTLEYTSDRVYSVDAHGTRRRLKSVDGGFVVVEGAKK